MKKSLIALLLCASALMAQPAKMAISGANTYLNQRVKFSGDDFLTLTSGQTVYSDPIVIESATIRPGQMIAIEYFGTSSNSANSSYRIDIESRICTTPSNSTGCPNQWLTGPWRRIYNTQRFADTVTVVQLPTDTTSVSHATMIPTGNQIRLKFQATGTSSHYFRDVFIRGF